MVNKIDEVNEVDGFDGVDRVDRDDKIDAVDRFNKVDIYIRMVLIKRGITASKLATGIESKISYLKTDIFVV